MVSPQTTDNKPASTRTDLSTRLDSESKRARGGRPTTAKTAKKTPAKTPAKKADGAKTSFAVFATGGKQYRVKVGDKLQIEKITGPSTSSGQATYEEGDSLVFDKVLLVDDGAEGATIGTPFISGAAVNATLIKVGRSKKIRVIKYKSKSRYFKNYGHRQPFFEITIDSIK